MIIYIHRRGTFNQYESPRSSLPRYVTFNVRNLGMACPPSTRFGNLGMLIIDSLQWVCPPVVPRPVAFDT